MSFAMPPKVVYTKTVNGQNVTVTAQVQDSNSVNVGSPFSVTLTLADSPIFAFKAIVQSALVTVRQNIAWSDVPASGTLSIPVVDVIDDN